MRSGEALASRVSAQVHAVCEGLGDVGERLLLDRPAHAWRNGTRVSAEPDTVWSPLAAARAVALGPGSARPDGSVSTGTLWVDAPSDELRTFNAGERVIPGVDIAGEPLRVADAWVHRIGHWSELLWANLLSLGPWLWAELVGHPFWLVVRGALRSPFGDVGAAFVHRGAGARIHSRATVEASWLGDGAEVRAGAVVRGAILGAGSVVEELAVVEGAVLGPRARVQRQALAKYAVIEADAAMAGIMQLGVIGAGAVVKHGAILMDMGLGAPVQVSRGGRLEPAPRGMIGVCVGPGAVVGQGVRVAPGRAIPAGLTVVGDPDQVLRSVAIGADVRRAHVRAGRLEAEG